MSEQRVQPIAAPSDRSSLLQANVGCGKRNGLRDVLAAASQTRQGESPNHQHPPHFRAEAMNSSSPPLQGETLSLRTLPHILWVWRHKHRLAPLQGEDLSLSAPSCGDEAASSTRCS
ncbi:hypothetical protein UY3_03266 [Chelonia mydas]|uniref:Uncharacterized protein n=1 Tax=Chelonia mydas TaxID=8469 RepID=M7BNK8_CHEMY|nr:hypothetical protein UY3_03266 [Chelonia mydas]